jgi:hypothetical protein
MTTDKPQDLQDQSIKLTRSVNDRKLFKCDKRSKFNELKKFVRFTIHQDYVYLFLASKVIYFNLVFDLSIERTFYEEEFHETIEKTNKIIGYLIEKFEPKETDESENSNMNTYEIQNDTLNNELVLYKLDFRYKPGIRQSTDISLFGYNLSLSDFKNFTYSLIYLKIINSSEFGNLGFQFGFNDDKIYVQAVFFGETNEGSGYSIIHVNESKVKYAVFYESDMAINQNLLFYIDNHFNFHIIKSFDMKNVQQDSRNFKIKEASLFRSNISFERFFNCHFDDHGDVPTNGRILNKRIIIYLIPNLILFPLLAYYIYLKWDIDLYLNKCLHKINRLSKVNYKILFNNINQTIN